MNPILYEYQTASYDSLGISSTHPFIEDLEVLNQKYGKEIIQVKRYELQTTHYVGMIQTRNGSLNVLPKIDDNLENELAATRNLTTMLCYAYDLPLVAQSDTAMKTAHGSWFEVLTALFVQRLYDQLRQGIERVYVTVEERSPALKGRWLLEQQLTRQAHIRHTFDIRYDDFLPDTPLNSIFLYTVEILKKISRAPQNQRLLAELQTLLGMVSLPHRITKDDLDRVLFTRLNERFYPAFQIARLFIESMTQVMQSGAVVLTGFIFDMNVLFESFVAHFLAKHWHEITGKSHKNFRLQVQMQGEESTYLAKRENRIPAFKLVPDLLVRDTFNQITVIIDTKYKRLDTIRLDISQTDIYQMLAYAGRLGTNRVLLLYPSNRGQLIDSHFVILNSQVQIDVRTINLHQSLGDHQTLIHDFRQILTPYLA